MRGHSPFPLLSCLSLSLPSPSPPPSSPLNLASQPAREHTLAIRGVKEKEGVRGGREEEEGRIEVKECAFTDLLQDPLKKGLLGKENRKAGYKSLSRLRNNSESSVLRRGSSDFLRMTNVVRHATAAAALTDQNKTTTTRKSQRLATAAGAAGLLLTATIPTTATYRDTRSRPRTSSHMSGVNPIRTMVAVALLSLLSSSPRSRQSLLPPLRLLT
ncbi:unnamed protein product [Pleuronectes platessa]|uniref:Uncharacterized protein n=1 Tax=Pleuronectes platessa TaxID=8262 RepID=A0A9N7TKS4_PLEPL|nr:unnamed protein product [Pleuronectes platessa]